MVIDVVVLLQLGLVVDGGRDVADNLGFVGLASNQTTALKSVKAATGGLGLLKPQHFCPGHLHHRGMVSYFLKFDMKIGSQVVLHTRDEAECFNLIKVG